MTREEEMEVMPPTQKEIEVAYDVIAFLYDTSIDNVKKAMELFKAIPPAEGAEKQYPYCPTCGDTIEHGEDYGGYCCTKCRDGHNNDFAAQPRPTAEGAEEILIDDIEAIADKYEIVERIDDDPDTGNMRFVINDQFVELVRVAAVKFATLHAQRIVDKMVEKMSPSNEQIHAAALAWARDHSEAPDKDCPTWLIRDYEAGAYFVRQCYGCLNKTDNLKSRK